MSTKLRNRLEIQAGKLNSELFPMEVLGRLVIDREHGFDDEGILRVLVSVPNSLSEPALDQEARTVVFYIKDVDITELVDPESTLRSLDWLAYA